MKLAAIFVMLALGGACTRPVAPPSGRAETGPEPTAAEARSYVQDFIEQCGMKEPGLAQVRAVKVAGLAKRNFGRFSNSATTGWLIQFEISARNSYDYIGFKPCEILVDGHKKVHWRPGEP
jgi:hypothetical protein